MAPYLNVSEPAVSQVIAATGSHNKGCLSHGHAVTRPCSHPGRQSGAVMRRPELCSFPAPHILTQVPPPPGVPFPNSLFKF